MNRVSPQLVVKIKHRHVMHSVTLGVHYVPLSQLQPVNEHGEESAGERLLHMHNPEANLGQDFDYTPSLPSQETTSNLCKSQVCYMSTSTLGRTCFLLTRTTSVTPTVWCWLTRRR